MAFGDVTRNDPGYGTGNLTIGQGLAPLPQLISGGGMDGGGPLGGSADPSGGAGGMLGWGNPGASGSGGLFGANTSGGGGFGGFMQQLFQMIQGLGMGGMGGMMGGGGGGMLGGMNGGMMGSRPSPGSIGGGQLDSGLMQLMRLIKGGG